MDETNVYSTQGKDWTDMLQGVLGSAANGWINREFYQDPHSQVELGPDGSVHRKGEESSPTATIKKAAPMLMIGVGVLILVYFMNK
ncbi:hypothetical protein R6242_10785 [Iodobacter sp. CM08]|uniref:hypothetical protein n=1 Tax=Iodobacter sp. CM08 TaxID=3085902 RepID=UPI0029814D2C|nr:hypothetical protein [Iodobacter sp. CM08]MDW5417050.1 hypothetical protein [Iodobacter sp. CM08]